MPKLRHSLLAAAVSAALPPFAQAQPAPDLDSLTAAQAAADICAGKYTSEALVGAALARARARADLNAFITLDEAGALKAARAADAARKRGACKPLDGVPVVIKDNIEVAGLPASAGTPALKGFVPKADAPVAAKLRAAGAIVLGKTNMHELAFGVSGYNTAFKSGDKAGVRNAYDPSKIAGGSSSGSGAAIGARIALAGLGTDTGGSVRIPCALNGCASLRPSVGRYAQQGIAPISHTRDTAGPMGVAMADVALLGGSFAPLGGQNLIEAAACGCPLLMGPHTFNFAQAAEDALAAGAAQRVADIEEGVRDAADLAGDPVRERVSRQALDFAARHRGAAERMAEAIVALLPPRGSRPATAGGAEPG